MTILAFAPMHNAPGRNDATGAFHPEAREFCKLHNAGSPKLFDNSKIMSARFSEVRSWLDLCKPATVGTVAFFCHGWKDGTQAGVTLTTAGRFADTLQRVLAPNPRIVLYCCDAARDSDNDREDEDDPGPGGDGGFADQLRDALAKRGVGATIYAHTTAAHTTRNPFVRRFDPGEMAGGHWIVTPYSADWQRWRKALQGTLRLRFPFMTQAQIESELKIVDGIA